MSATIQDFFRVNNATNIGELWALKFSADPGYKDYYALGQMLTDFVNAKSPQLIDHGSSYCKFGNGFRPASFVFGGLWLGVFAMRTELRARRCQQIIRGRPRTAVSRHNIAAVCVAFFSRQQ